MASSASLKAALGPLPSVGDNVLVDPYGLVGQVMFVGKTKFARGQWIGLSLKEADGRHDGVVQGKRYFKTKANHGLFVRPNAVHPLRADPSTVKEAKPRGRALKRHESYDAGDQLKLGTVHEDVFPAALDYENFNFLKILVEEDKIPATGTDKHGNTALHVVAKKGGGKQACQVLAYLLDHGLRKDIHARNIYGQTAVMVAAKNKRWAVVEFLVAEGADIISKVSYSIEDDFSNSGVSNSMMSVWDSCQNIEQGMQSLHEGMRVSRERRENGLLTVPDMKHKESTMRQALFKTAAAGDIRYVRMLIEERGLPVNSKDREGNTVLHWVANNAKRLKIIKYLVGQGAKIHVVNYHGDTPGLIAARSRAWPVMTYLVSIGASVSMRDTKNHKSIFQYAQANMISRKALADGLADKKRNAQAVQEPDEDEIAYIQEAEEEEQRRDKKGRKQKKNRGGAAEAEEKGPTDELEEDSEADEDDEDNEEITESEIADPNEYKNAEEVEADLRVASEHILKKQEAAEQQAKEQPKVNRPAEVQQSAAAKKLEAMEEDIPSTEVKQYPGIVTGKKRDKSKEKHCVVLINDDCIQVAYTKGSLFNRRNLTDQYKWNDQMSIEKISDDKLIVKLDPEESVGLTIHPCPAEQLEEFIWKHIWKTVFEGSVQEAKQLLGEYEQLCQDTVNQIRSKLKERAGLEKAKGKDSEAAVDSLSGEILELIDRFAAIRAQGETLLETFSKMYEALERRLATEQQRQEQFIGQEQFQRAREVKRDQEAIHKQMTLVESDRDKVSGLYEKMKQEELNYAYLKERDEDLGEQW